VSAAFAEAERQANLARQAEAHAKAQEAEAKAREDQAKAREQEALAREADAREQEAPFKVPLPLPHFSQPTKLIIIIIYLFISIYN
jgi:hypothetical protein